MARGTKKPDTHTASASDPPRDQEHLTREAAAHRGELVRFLRKRMRNSDDAEEVAQEAYLRLLQRADADHVRYLRTYLFRAALNIAADRERTQHARLGSEHCSLDEVELIDGNPSAERQVAAHQDLAQLYDAIAQLPTKCRQVFLLSRVHHMTYAEIARQCGISVKMVEKHITHALAVCLRKVGGSGPKPSNSV